jgi:hypothetical protein
MSEWYPGKFLGRSLGKGSSVIIRCKTREEIEKFFSALGGKTMSGELLSGEPTDPEFLKMLPKVSVIIVDGMIYEITEREGYREVEFHIRSVME